MLFESGQVLASPFLNKDNNKSNKNDFAAV